MVIPSFEPIIGGAERQLKQLSQFLLSDSDNFKVTILTRRVDSLPKYQVCDSIPTIRLIGRLYPHLFLLHLFLYLKNKVEDIDVIHVHTLNSPAVLCVIFGLLYKKPVILKVTRSGSGSQIAQILASKFKSNLYRFILNSASKVIALTKDVQSDLDKLSVKKEKVDLIPNGVQSFPYKEKILEKVIFIYIGRLIKRKNVNVLLSAWSEANVGPDCELRIIGDGPELSSLLNLSKRLGIQSSVHFLGGLPHQDVLEELQKSQIFVLPSESEGMLNALLEAMSMINAVIVSNIRANSEIIVNGVHGLLFDGEQQLATAIKHLSTDHNMIHKLSLNAKDLVDTRFSFNVVSKMYKNLYLELCKR